MGGNPRGDDPFPDILHRRQAQVLARRYVAEEVGARRSCYRPADGAGDMVVAGGDVGDERAEHIEGGAVAEPLLEKDVRLDLVDGHVAGTFDHYLHPGVHSALGQLAEDDQFMDLGAVGGVGKAAGAETVPQRQYHVVFAGNLQQFVEMLEEGVFLVVVAHPLDGERAPTRDHVHDPSFVLHPFHRAAGDSAMDGDEIDPVFRMFHDSVEHFVNGHVHDGFLPRPHGIEGGLVERHAADAGVRFSDDGPADLIHRPSRGKVHDGIRPEGDGNTCFFQLLRYVQVVGGGSDVGVHLGAQSLTHCQGAPVAMFPVVADDAGTFDDTVTDEFRRYSLAEGRLLHFAGDDALAGLVELCHEDSCLWLLKSSHLAAVVPYGGSMFNVLGSRF